MLPGQSKLAWSIVMTILHLSAISSTVLRLCHRVHKRQLWWDDYITIIPLVLDCIYVVVVLISLSNGDYLRYPRGRSSSVFTSFFFGFILNLTILWFARISLALSLARIFPSGHLARKISLFLSGLYLSFFFIVSGLVIGLCQGENLPWYNIDPSNCMRSSKQIPLPGLFGILSDFIADLLLFIAPSLMLRKVRLPNNELRLILAAFSASILTLLSTIIFAIFWYSRLDLGSDVVLLRIAIAQIETTTSLIVCNILMVTMFFYRIFRRAPSTPQAEKPKAIGPPPLPPVAAGAEDAREIQKIVSREITDNVVNLPTHLTLTEIEEYAGEFIRSYGDDKIALQIESAPALGQRSFSLASRDFFCSLPPKRGDRYLLRR